MLLPQQLQNRGSILDDGRRLHISHHVQIGSGLHPASSESIHGSVSLPRHHLVPSLRIRGSAPSLRTHLHGLVPN
jgi:hypothetical protein